MRNALIAAVIALTAVAGFLAGRESRSDEMIRRVADAAVDQTIERIRAGIAGLEADTDLEGSRVADMAEAQADAIEAEAARLEGR